MIDYTRYNFMGLMAHTILIGKPLIKIEMLYNDLPIFAITNFWWIAAFTAASVTYLKKLINCKMWAEIEGFEGWKTH